MSSRRNDNRRSNAKPRRPPVHAAAAQAGRTRERKEILDEGAPVEEDRSGFERLIFFSDAVFAIAITLLVIDIHLPDDAGSDLSGALHHLLPNFEGFVISFLVIAIYWMTHHRLFGHIRGYNRRLIWNNMYVLMAVVFLPFSTSLVSSYGDRSLAVIFYALNLALIGICFLWFWLHAVYLGHHVDPKMPREAIGANTLSLLIPPVVFLVTVPIAFVSPTVAKLAWLMIPVLYAAIGRWNDAARKYLER